VIITVAGTVENTGITTLALELARSMTDRVDPKTRTVQASSVLLVEADPAGGVLSSLMPEVEQNHTSSLQKLMNRPPHELDEWEHYAWKHKGHHNKLRCLFSSTLSSEAVSSIRNDEQQFADYLQTRVDIITVVDAGRVLSKRAVVQAADTEIWVLNPNHPASILRTRNVAAPGLMMAGEKRLAALTGPPASMNGSVEEAVGFPVAAVLPHPEKLLGDTPSRGYRKAVEQLAEQIIPQ